MIDLQQLAYEYGYKLAMLALNPDYTYDADNPTLPDIPVIQDQQDQSSPITGRYVAVQGSPTLEPFGSPYMETLDDDGTRGLVQHYTATIIFWEVNGNGSYLNAIRETSFLTSAHKALDSQYVTFNDTSSVQDVSYKLDNSWKMQSRMTMTVSVASRITETVDYATSIDYTVNATTQGG